MKESNNCWDCKYIIQGEGSVCCAHPERKMEDLGRGTYIYWCAYNTCDIGKFEKHNDKTQEERYDEVAKEVGWVKTGKMEEYADGSAEYREFYEPILSLNENNI